MTKANNQAAKVVLIGLHADHVDFEKWPQLSKEKLENAFEAVIEELTQEGFEAAWCLTDRGETAAEQVRSTLVEVVPDIVLIGAGVRTDPEHFILFETVINIVHETSPQAKIAFNQLPYDSVEAVKRWAE